MTPTIIDKAQVECDPSHIGCELFRQFVDAAGPDLLNAVTVETQQECSSSDDLDGIDRVSGTSGWSITTERFLVTIERKIRLEDFGDIEFVVRAHSYGDSSFVFELFDERNKLIESVRSNNIHGSYRGERFFKPVRVNSPKSRLEGYWARKELFEEVRWEFFEATTLRDAIEKATSSPAPGIDVCLVANWAMENGSQHYIREECSRSWPYAYACFCYPSEQGVPSP